MVKSSWGRFARSFLCMMALGIIAACSTPQRSGAAPYAAYVMDARTGETLFSDNADTKLHPASLTKMMTLYITFQEIEAGNLSLDTIITVSSNAAAQPPSRLGLKSGQKIALRYLIRAAAVKSANDAAAAIGDAISGSPAKFGARMTRTAKSLGMKNTTLKNANGLTAKGHVSTAHDMSTLGRRLFYDFPQYYNIFSRRTTDAGMATVNNTNRRFLDAYEGADGIKTGYTDAAGFNLTASAERNGVRIIATVFGGSSTADRNAKVAKLLDLGFSKADPGARTVKPEAPAPAADGEMIAGVDEALPEVEGGAGKTVRVAMAVASSPRPQPRRTADPAAAVAAEVAVASMQADIAGALAEATEEAIDMAVAEAATPAAATLVDDIAIDIALDAVALADTAAPDDGSVVELSGLVAGAGVFGETQVAVAETLAAPAAPQELTISAAPAAEPMQLAAVTRPAKRNLPIYDDALVVEVAETLPEAEVVTRVSTSGGSHFGVNLGNFTTRDRAERALLRIQLNESEALGSGLRKVNASSAGGYDANILGLTQDEADLACRRLQQRATTCFTLAP